MWILTSVVHITLNSIILWGVTVLDGTKAASINRTSSYQRNDLFPQQPWTPPEKIQDGQSIMDKIFIMKMINYLEWDIVKRRGGAKSYPYLREYIYEGDIILTKQQILNFIYPVVWPGRKRRKRRKRKLNVKVLGDSPVKKWDLPIEYNIASSHTQEGQEAIRSGIQNWEDQTCIGFIEKDNSTGPFLHFNKGDGCYAFIGKSSDGMNPVFISENCYTAAVVAHEIGHSLGFWHEHARGDRDLYVHTIDDNIIPGMNHNFQKLSWAVLDNLGVPYDIASVMHYNALEFSIGDENGQKTIESRDPFVQNSMGQRLELSFYDVKLANKVYCSDICDPALLNGVCKYDGYQDPKNCSRCRCPDGLSGNFCESVAPSDGNCGGELVLAYGQTHTIRSPGYPNYYDDGSNCFWLFKSPEGTRIKMKFTEPFMNSSFCQPKRQYLPCVDYVELRIKDNLGHTGGRFCCDDYVQRSRLTNETFSHNNHSLILFKTIASGRNGFQLHLSYESCGGCFSNITDKQVPCFRHVTSMCYQTWFAYENVTTYTNNKYPATNEANTTTMEVKKQRTSVCASEEPYCCYSYVLSADNSSCIAPVDSTTATYVSTTQSTTNTATTEPTSVDNATVATTSTNDVTQIGGNTSEPTAGDENVPSWSAWSSWSTCSYTCGGCGLQNRSRSCETEAICVGSNSETRSCNLAGCNTDSVIQFCNRTIETTYPCGFFFGGTTCTSNEIVLYSQPSQCCCGYNLVGDICEQTVF